MTKQLSTKDFFAQESVKNKFKTLLGERSAQFITSVLQISSDNALLSKASAESIYHAAMTAALIGLPINKSLGKAWIVPYKGNAQFQLGYKGLIELAVRTGQYHRINSVPIYANQFKSWDSLSETLIADTSTLGQGDPIGYAAYFKLLNGFEKFEFWRKEEVEKHMRRFSKSYDSGPWKTDFDKMALKTVLKSIVGTYGPLSIEMERAMTCDQKVVKNSETVEVEYVDVQEETNERLIEEEKRVLSALENTKTREEVQELVDSLPQDVFELDSVKQKIGIKYRELNDGQIRNT